MKKKGTKIETLALFHEDTIFGTDSANTQIKLADERGYKIATDIKYRAELALADGRSAAAESGRMPTC